MRTAILLALASVALTACGGGSDRPVVINQPPANVTVAPPAPVVIQPSAPTSSTTTTTIVCPPGTVC